LQFEEFGNKYIAHVKTNKGGVLEFQHSYLKPEGRDSINSFYQKLDWVVNGLRRKTHKVQFENVLKESSKAPVGNVNIRQLNFPTTQHVWMRISLREVFEIN
jgi:hypothetical protein